MRQIGLLILSSYMLLSGCAGSGCRTSVGDPSVTPSVVSATGSHIGESVQWGGSLVETRHSKDSTELEVVGYPLDDCGRPRPGSKQLGRFLIVYPGFLETADYQAGRQVSATGRITEIRKGRLGDASYSFPVLESYRVQLWPEQQASRGYSRPWVNIGIGGGSGSVFGGVGVIF